jgi:hypothetical protein
MGEFGNFYQIFNLIEKNESYKSLSLNNLQTNTNRLLELIKCVPASTAFDLQQSGQIVEEILNHFLYLIWNYTGEIHD